MILARGLSCRGRLLPYWSGSKRFALRAFQRRTIPSSQTGRRAVCAFQKFHQRRFWVGRCPNSLVGQDEFPKPLVEISSLGRDRSIGKPSRGRVGVGIESREIRSAAAGPETSGRDFVAICFTRHVIRQSRNAAGMKRGLTPGKPGQREIEAAPK